MVARVLDTVLRSGKAVFPDGATVEADIGIAGGRIAAIAAPGALAGVATVDLKGLLVMPGVVDAHIHLDMARTSVGRAPPAMPKPSRLPPQPAG
jgi:cytosine/adenosine deaminase-related metal-dependent hydrolase